MEGFNAGYKYGRFRDERWVKIINPKSPHFGRGGQITPGEYWRSPEYGYLVAIGGLQKDSKVRKFRTADLEPIGL